eukprot:CAMPEP_0182483252 /NCGR_PEP_ID=MMETSP1319-20130603/40938_1 /TAXON_ID=172717 /ORGANISM="Bolidomonas pacifica, Strain RCC208" /LENGTH=196 /DNA_ID=CAMNT_0024685035 /DNA_START=141 /DNA_END=730 /DNA_ORIENTATION=-
MNAVSQSQPPPAPAPSASGGNGSLAGHVVVPGDRLYNNVDGSASAGPGCHKRGGMIHSCRVGTVRAEEGEGGVTVISVEGPRSDRLLGQVVDVGMLITGKVTRVTPAAATVAILAAGGVPLESPTFTGVVRLEDVTQVNAEEVEMMSCYRLGDIVLARVISLGDSRTFFLTTAEEQLGVCIALSKASGGGAQAAEL